MISWERVREIKIHEKFIAARNMDNLPGDVSCSVSLADLSKGTVCACTVPAQNLTFFPFPPSIQKSRTCTHFAKPGRHGLPFGFVDPLGGITTRWKGRWKYTPKMKRRSKIRQKILWSVVQQPPNTNFTTARGLKQTMEWDLNDSFSNFENGIFSVCEKMYPSVQSLPDEISFQELNFEDTEQGHTKWIQYVLAIFNNIFQILCKTRIPFPLINMIFLHGNINIHRSIPQLSIYVDLKTSQYFHIISFSILNERDAYSSFMKYLSC